MLWVLSCTAIYQVYGELDSIQKVPSGFVKVDWLVSLIFQSIHALYDLYVYPTIQCLFFQVALVEGKTPMRKLSFNCQSVRCKHFDNCNGALLAPGSSHIGHEVPKFTVETVFHVQ
jgi:hypothetical protein